MPWMNPSFSSSLESHSHVPGWSLLHWLRKQHQQWNMPIIAHRNCTSKAPRKGNNSLQDTLVLGCHHCGLDFLRNIDDSAAPYAGLYAFPLPSFHCWMAEFVYQHLPKPKDNGPDY